MAQTIIHFYSTSTKSEPLEVIQRMITFLKPEAILVGRSAGLDDSWRRFKSNLDDEGLPSELLLEPRDLAGALAEYRNDKSFGLALIRSSVVMQMNEEYRLQMPEIVRGHHWPCETSLLINPHDIFEDFLNENGHYFARAFASLKIWGDSHPSDFENYQKGVKRLDTFRKIEAELKDIWGEVDCAFYLQG